MNLYVIYIQIGWLFGHFPLKGDKKNINIKDIFSKWPSNFDITCGQLIDKRWKKRQHNWMNRSKDRRMDKRTDELDEVRYGQ
jgi:hypothetical protein